MNIYIQTRSVMKDYQFLGNSPISSWWMAYKEYTSFEHPTMIVEGDTDQQWRIYLSGMSGSWVDKVHTPIRYTFILEDTKPVLESELPQLLGFIQAWTKAIYDPESKTKLKSCLDTLFSIDEINTYFTSSEQNKGQIQSRFKQWLSSFTFTDVELAGDILSNSYIGSLEQSQRAFFQRCKSILKMNAKCSQAALHLNYIESKNELESTQLVEEEYMFRFTLLVEAEGVGFSEINLKKKVVQPQKIQELPRRKSKFLKHIPYLLIGITVIVLVILFI